MQICLPSKQYFCQNYHLWYHSLSATMVFHTALLHIREFTSQQKKWDNEPVLMKFTDFTMFSHHPEVSGLKEWLEDLKCQLGDNTLQGIVCNLPKDVCFLNLCQTYGSISFIARIHWSRNQEDGNEDSITHSHP